MTDRDPLAKLHQGDYETEITPEDIDNFPWWVAAIIIGIVALIAGFIVGFN